MDMSLRRASRKVVKNEHRIGSSGFKQVPASSGGWIPDCFGTTMVLTQVTSLLYLEGASNARCGFFRELQDVVDAGYSSMASPFAIACAHTQVTDLHRIMNIHNHLADGIRLTRKLSTIRLFSSAPSLKCSICLARSNNCHYSSYELSRCVVTCHYIIIWHAMTIRMGVM